MIIFIPRKGGGMKWGNPNSTKTHKSGGVLDLILTNAPRCYTPETLAPLISYEGVESDHYTIIARATQAAYCAHRQPVVKKLVRSGRIAYTVDFLRRVNMLPIIDLARRSPERATNHFYQVLQTAQNTCQPLKPLKLRDDQPWMTLEIKQLINKRQQLHQTKKHSEYNKVAHQVIKAIHKRKRLFYRCKFPATNTKWCKLVNETRSQQQTAPDDQQLAIKLNDGFHGVWGGSVQPDLSEYTSIECARRLNRSSRRATSRKASKAWMEARLDPTACRPDF